MNRFVELTLTHTNVKIHLNSARIISWLECRSEKTDALSRVTYDDGTDFVATVEVDESHDDVAALVRSANVA